MLEFLWIHFVVTLHYPEITGLGSIDVPPPPSGLGNFKGVMLCEDLKDLHDHVGEVNSKPGFRDMKKG